MTFLEKQQADEKKKITTLKMKYVLKYVFKHTV